MEIRTIKTSEYKLLVEFLNDYWKQDHSLVKSKSLLDFQHLEINKYNFYAAFDDNRIIGLFGFIPTSHYDQALVNNKDCWGAIWKVIENPNYKGIGIDILNRILTNEGKSSFSAIGISKIAKTLYFLLGMNIGFLNQYYIVNYKIEKFKICNNPLIDKLENHSFDIKWYFKPIQTLLNNKIFISYYYKPTKSIVYFINRYERHPIYKYSFYGIYCDEMLVNIWVGRRITVENTSILRIVDVLGPLEVLPDLYIQIQQVLSEESLEYIDFLNFGLNQSVFEKIGFRHLNYEEKDLIIPNYFDPFERNNIKIELAYKSNCNYVAFKGDSDQDRPNIL